MGRSGGLRIVSRRACRRIGALLLFVSALSITGVATAAAAAPPFGTLLTPYQATYRLRQGPITLARATFSLRKASDQDEWELTSLTETQGWLSTVRADRIEETSRFRIQGDRLLPLHYQMRHEAPGETKTETANFNWPARRVTGAVDRSPFDLRLPEHTYDRLSLQVLVRAAALRDISPIRIRMLEKNKIKPIRFESTAAIETLETPAGRFETLRMTQLDSKKPMTFWLAPQAHYLPVRVEQDRGSLHLKLELEALQIGPARITPAAR